MGKNVKLRAFAKANLSLNITGKSENGLHTLDSFMMSVDVFDTLTVTERTDGQINVKFINAEIDAQNNTAYKAARAVHDIIGGNGWDIEIEKGIPMGAGLGGSSADGAAVLRALDLFYRLPQRGVNMREVALSVGSDVPFMLTGGLARVTGTGDRLFFIDNKLSLFIVGLMGCDVSTAKAYAEFDRLHASGSFCPTDNAELQSRLLAGETTALELLGNALYEPAANLCGGIAKNAELLKKRGATVNMTGSGGMTLGYFTDIEKFAQCAKELGGLDGFCALAPVKTGILHEWIDRDNA